MIKEIAVLCFLMVVCSAVPTPIEENVADVEHAIAPEIETNLDDASDDLATAEFRGYGYGGGYGGYGRGYGGYGRGYGGYRRYGGYGRRFGGYGGYGGYYG